MTQATVLYHRQRASKTRKEILCTSMDIASAEGLEGLSIGRLATELQISKTGIFAHFGSKEQLQLTTVDAAKHVFLEQMVQPALIRLRNSCGSESNASSTTLTNCSRFILHPLK